MGAGVCVEAPTALLPFFNCLANVFVVADLHAFIFLQLSQSPPSIMMLTECSFKLALMVLEENDVSLCPGKVLTFAETVLVL